MTDCTDLTSGCADLTSDCADLTSGCADLTSGCELAAEFILENGGGNGGFTLVLAIANNLLNISSL